MKPVDLIAQAHRLSRATKKKPRQVDLRRAISAAYYAMFHVLAKDCADAIVGMSSARSAEAWRQIYRALEHGGAKNACEQVRNIVFPEEIKVFAETFVTMQQWRHDADYDPDVKYVRAEVNAMLVQVEAAIMHLHETLRTDRRAFIALVLFPQRRRR